jgi:hypothetical protein
MGEFRFARHLALIACLMAAMSGVARAQFNIDLDLEFAPPQNGGGVPSAAFGAAANQPGLWNSIPATSNGPTALRDISGQLTSVIITGSSGGVGGAFNNPTNTGDFALLLNDANAVGGPGFNSWTFTNVPNGSYHIYTYAVWPGGGTSPHQASVSITGSFNQNPQIVTGPMPGNQFVLGVTHSIHDILVESGTFTLQIDSVASSHPYANGFQVVAVPESGLFLTVACGFIPLVVRERRPMRGVVIPRASRAGRRRSRH